MVYKHATIACTDDEVFIDIPVFNVEASTDTCHMLGSKHSYVSRTGFNFFVSQGIDVLGFKIRHFVHHSSLCVIQARVAKLAVCITPPLSWLSVCYMTLIRATAFHVCLQTESVTIRIFVGEFLALSAVDYLAHDCTPFHSSLSVFGRT